MLGAKARTQGSLCIASHKPTWGASVCLWVPVLFQETVDMLKSHIKEELMQGEEADDVYESMAHLSTDLLMKCSLNPGCDEELYESMAAFVPDATEDLCK